MTIGGSPGQSLERFPCSSLRFGIPRLNREPVSGDGALHVTTLLQQDSEVVRASGKSVLVGTAVGGLRTFHLGTLLEQDPNFVGAHRRPALLSTAVGELITALEARAIYVQRLVAELACGAEGLVVPRYAIRIECAIGLVVPAVDQLAGARDPALVPVELHQLEHLA